MRYHRSRSGRLELEAHIINLRNHDVRVHLPAPQEPYAHLVPSLPVRRRDLVKDTRVTRLWNEAEDIERQGPRSVVVEDPGELWDVRAPPLLYGLTRLEREVAVKGDPVLVYQGRVDLPQRVMPFTPEALGQAQAEDEKGGGSLGLDQSLMELLAFPENLSMDFLQTPDVTMADAALPDWSFAYTEPAKLPEGATFSGLSRKASEEDVKPEIQPFDAISYSINPNNLDNHAATAASAAQAPISSPNSLPTPRSEREPSGHRDLSPPSVGAHFSSPESPTHAAMLSASPSPKYSKVGSHDPSCAETESHDADMEDCDGTPPSGPVSAAAASSSHVPPVRENSSDFVLARTEFKQNQSEPPPDVHDDDMEAEEEKEATPERPAGHRNPPRTARSNKRIVMSDTDGSNSELDDEDLETRRERLLNKVGRTATTVAGRGGRSGAARGMSGRRRGGRGGFTTYKTRKSAAMRGGGRGGGTSRRSTIQVEEPADGDTEPEDEDSLEEQEDEHDVAVAQLSVSPPPSTAEGDAAATTVAIAVPVWAGAPKNKEWVFHLKYADRVEVYSLKDRMWYKSRALYYLIGEGMVKLKVHYNGYRKSYDDWVELWNADGIRRLRKVGEGGVPGDERGWRFAPCGSEGSLKQDDEKFDIWAEARPWGLTHAMKATARRGEVVCKMAR
ncbi:hypothetical protein HK101_000406 [Irineochytrium annulatum]|nr:hypothetical protein HK101_000406 [Irineochytrium annulatum]